MNISFDAYSYVKAIYDTMYDLATAQAKFGDATILNISSSTMGNISFDQPFNLIPDAGSGAFPREIVEDSGTSPYILSLYFNAGEEGKFWIVVTEFLSITACEPDSKFSKSKVAVGQKYYTDRDYVIIAVPASYLGMEMIMTPNDEQNLTQLNSYLNFAAPADGMVYIGYDSRAVVLPKWMNKFEFTGDVIKTSLSTQPYLKIYIRSHLMIASILGSIREMDLRAVQSATSLYFTMPMFSHRLVFSTQSSMVLLLGRE